MHAHAPPILTRTHSNVLLSFSRSQARDLTAISRAQRSHDDSFIAKRFVFEAFDCYLSLFYIAFELRNPALAS